MITFLIVLVFFIALLLISSAVYNYRCRKAADYQAEEIRLAEARTEAIRTGNVFSTKNFRQVENRLKVTHPHLNRRQRKEKAAAVREQFILDVKAGLM